MSNTNSLYSFALGDIYDPLHWHLGRVANLSARPYGTIQKRGDWQPTFDNFSDDVDKERVYYDTAGIAWILQSPPKSAFHQPKWATREWERILTNPLFTRPTEPKYYPMRKFMTKPDARNRSFELVLQPDDINVVPYTYREQKVLKGPLGGTYNYGGNDASHLALDIVPHDGTWVDSQTLARRPGGDYTDFGDDESNAIKPKYGESQSEFRIRVGHIADSLDDVRRAARGQSLGAGRLPSHDLQWARNIVGAPHQFLLVPRRSTGKTVMVRPELNHVIVSYLDYKETLPACRNAGR